MFVSETPNTELDQLRHILLGDAQTEIIELRERVSELEAIAARVSELESALAYENRATATGEILVDSVAANRRAEGELGSALRNEIELAVSESARTDSTVLADALYPVMGPAMRKMIANIFSFDQSKAGKTFKVQQVLLIERSSGLMLAATAHDESHLDDADVVSGMLDAIRRFVQDAFNTEDHDGLQDLRVGDTSVLVEWGPDAVLASVIRGIPTDAYRTRAAQTLELIHSDRAEDFETFNGDVTPFNACSDDLSELLRAGKPALAKQAGATMYVLAILVLVSLVAVVLYLS